MLARLELIDGVMSAETDEAGDHLRLSARDDGVIADVRVALTALGYGAEPVIRDPRIARWFGVRTVRELSLIEAGVIADRIVPQLAGRLPAGDPSRLRSAVIGALHACFVGTDLTSAAGGDAFRADCVRQAIAAASTIVGAALAQEVGRLLDLDMRESHKMPPA